MRVPLPSPDERWRGARGALAWLAVLAAVLLRFHPMLAPDGTYPEHDWLQVHAVDAEHVVQAVKDGSLVPLWSPFLLGGSPLYAVATKPLSYPPFLLVVALLGATAGMNVLALAHVLLAAAGMLRLARRVGCGPAPSAAAAILLVAATWPGSFFKSQPFWAYAVAWWPWALGAAIDVLDARERRALVPAALRLGVYMALQVLAGGVFQAYWLGCFLLAFSLPFLLRRRDEPGAPRRAAALLLAGATAFLLSAVRVLPALAWMSTSGRSAGLSDEDILSGYDDLSTDGGAARALAVLRVLLLRDTVLGTWALAAGCVLALLLARRRRLAWAGAAGVAACLLVATALLHDQLVAWLPGYDRMRMPYRFLAAAGLGAALLTALGLEGLLQRLPRAAAGPALALGALLLLADVQLVPGWRWVAPPASPMSEVTAMAAPVMDALDDGSRGRFLSPTSRYQSLWVARGLRSTAGVLGGSGAASPAYAAWLPPEATPLELEALHRGVLDVLGVRFTTSFEALDVPWLTPVFEPQAPRPLRLDAPAVRREADPYDAYLLRNLQARQGEPYLRPWVYRRDGALPHASLVERVVLVVGEEEARAAALHEALDRRGFDARTTVYVEEPSRDVASLGEPEVAGLAGVLFAGLPAEAPEPRALRARWGGQLVPQKDGSVTWLPDAPRDAGLRPLDEATVEATCNDLTLELPAGAASVLLLSETFTLHPGWTARIDGEPAELLRADGCITAVRLPDGARRVVLSYTPPGLRTGALLSALALLALVLLSVRARRRA